MYFLYVLDTRAYLPQFFKNVTVVIFQVSLHVRMLRGVVCCVSEREGKIESVCVRERERERKREREREGGVYRGVNL